MQFIKAVFMGSIKDLFSTFLAQYCCGFKSRSASKILALLNNGFAFGKKKQLCYERMNEGLFKPLSAFLPRG